MELQVNNKYKTRGGNIAVVTQDVSAFDPVYSMKGFVTDNDGNIVRAICMWTYSGNYTTHKQSQFDIINEL